MFADRLSREESQALVDLLVYIAHADGRLDPEEVRFIDRFAADRGVVANIHEPPEDLERATSRLVSRAAKVIAVQELVRIGLCDGIFDAPERLGVRRVADACGLEPGIVESVEAWVREGLAWVARGETLLHGPNGADLPPEEGGR